MSYREINTSNYPALMERYHIGSLLAKVLIGMDYSEGEIASFFDPLNDFKLDEALFEPIAKQLYRMKENGQKAFVFGDYDADGITATAIMMMVLKKLGIEAGYYIPSRINEGYGLNVEKLALAAQKGYDVLITVDNGVAAGEALAWAKDHGIVTIVTDHHIISEPVASDYLLHPSLMGEGYQYLCGAGVAYMLAKYLKLDDDQIKVLAMVATIGDVMSLKGINIRIVNEGLDLVNAHRAADIERLEMFNYPVDETQIGFRIVPKLNSVGRISEKPVSEVNQVVRYFLTDDVREKTVLAQMINDFNDRRKQLSAAETALAKEQLEANAAVNFVYDPALHVGVLGLIATRLAAETNKITFVLTEKDDRIVGSGRSAGDIDIMALLEGFRPYTLNLGGHAGACGITIPADQLHHLKTYLQQQCEGLDTESIYDFIQCNTADLSLANIQEVFRYKPYGQDRRIPLIRTTIVNDAMRTLKSDHQLKWNSNGLDIVSFDNQGADHYRQKNTLDIVGNLGENIFRGRVTYQIMAKEIIDRE